MPTSEQEDHEVARSPNEPDARAGSRLRARPGDKIVSRRIRIVLSISALLLTVITVSMLLHPLATNDGPVHVAFSHFILTHNQADEPLQSQTYTLDLSLKPNLSVYLLMATLMRVFSPEMTESIIQTLCIVCPFLAGYFALHSINRKNVWLSIFFIPFSLNQTLFLGLYNHCLSVAAFFVAIGTYFWMCRAPSYRRAAWLAAAVVLTFLCHASGLVMALAGLGAMAATGAALSMLRKRSFVAALKAERYTLLAMVAPLPLVAVFLRGGGTSLTKYGINLNHRLLDFSKLHLLAVNVWQVDRYAAFTISTLLITSFLVVVVRTILKSSVMPQSRRDQLIAAIVATLVATAVMLAFPDVMGGGWTHFRRFVAYPYLWVVLVLAFEEFSAPFFAGFAAIGTAAAAMLIASTLYRQRTIRELMVPLAQVDARIGSHCSVAAIPLEPSMLDEKMNFEWLEYQPFFQVASRLELHGDRVVLFNYLARLAPYPVHFRPQMEPQSHLYLWQPMQMENEVEKVDVDGFEAGSSLRVDYILLWGRPERNPPPVRAQVRNALRQFDEIYRSANGVVTLYERRAVHNAACTATPLGQIGSSTSLRSLN